MVMVGRKAFVLMLVLPIEKESLVLRESPWVVERAILSSGRVSKPPPEPPTPTPFY